MTAKPYMHEQRGPKLEPYQIVLRPLVTEKGTHQFTHRNAYPFEVNIWATKHQIILRPLVTEKGTHQSTNQHHNAYSFEVNLWANKAQIKLAVQELFNVRVLAVRTQLRLGKVRRYRFKHGKLSNWKKAIVVLKPSSPGIDFF